MAKVENNNMLRRNSNYLILNSIIGSGLGFLFWVVIARYYAPNDVGLAAALISLVSLIACISRLGLDMSIIRYIGGEADRRGAINTCLTVTSVTTLLIALIFSIGIHFFGRDLDIVWDSVFCSITFVGITVMFSQFNMISSFFIALKEVQYLFWQNMIMLVLKLFLPLALVPLFYFGIFASWGAAVTIGVGISLMAFLRKIDPDYYPHLTIDKRFLKRSFHFSCANYLVNISGNIPSYFLPLMIVYYLSPADNAYYSISFAIASFLFMIPAATSMSAFAEGSTSNINFISNLLDEAKYTLVIVLLGVALIILLKDKVLLIFGSDYVKGGSHLLLLLSLSSIFVTINTLYNSYLRVQLKNLELVAVTVIPSLGIVLISYYLSEVLQWGVSGIGYGFLISHGFLTAYILIQIIKETILRSLHMP